MVKNEGKMIEFKKNFGNEFTNFWFDRKYQKFIHCTDTFYYSIDIENDWMYDANVQVFLDYLDNKKKKLYESEEPVILTEIDSMYIMNSASFAKIYYYCIESTDRYWIFVAKGKPGKDTPPFLIQLRSQFLWLYGEDKAIAYSLREIEQILFPKFHLDLKCIKANRFDPAFHTNYIQDSKHFFKIDELNSGQVSNFKKFRIYGNLDGDNDVGVDYVGYGSRESNNVFVRIYNKTREVCEMGYKQFFFKIWFLNGLISRYDMYCLEKCFMKKNYGYLSRARLEWYIEHSKNNELKVKAQEYIDKYDSLESDNVLKFVNTLTPPVTIIYNIEYQCKRKFISSIKFKGDKTEYDERYKDVQQFLKYKKPVIDYLTNYVFRMVDPKLKGYERKRNKPANAMWILLQNVSMDKPVLDKDFELVREYQSDLDKELIVNKVVSNVATFSLYHNNINDSNFGSDMVDYLNYINENDMVDYNKKKAKKALQVTPKLEKLSQKIKNDKEILVTHECNSEEYVIIDTTTGEIIQLPLENIIYLN